jgi:hypothetical protein
MAISGASLGDAAAVANELSRAAARSPFYEPAEVKPPLTEKPPE